MCFWDSQNDIKMKTFLYLSVAWENKFSVVCVIFLQFGCDNLLCYFLQSNLFIKYKVDMRRTTKNFSDIHCSSHWLTNCKVYYILYYFFLPSFTSVQRGRWWLQKANGEIVEYLEGEESIQSWLHSAAETCYRGLKQPQAPRSDHCCHKLYILPCADFCVVNIVTDSRLNICLNGKMHLFRTT